MDKSIIRPTRLEGLILSRLGVTPVEGPDLISSLRSLPRWIYGVSAHYMAIGRMEARGWVESTVSSRDERIKNYVITGSGRRALDALREDIAVLKEQLGGVRI